MLKPTNFEKVTVSKMVVDHIKDLIIQRKLSSGEKLPSERDMSELIQVSRNTVRESYKILAALGYVEIKHGQGVYVANANVSLGQWAASFFTANDQIIELFEIRKILETQSVIRAVETATNEQIEKLQALVDKAHEGIKENSNIDYIFKIDQEFHLFLAELSNNSVLLRIMYNLIDLLEESRKRAIQIPERPMKSIIEHQEIVNAISDRDAKRAEKKMLAHLISVEKEIKNFKNK